MDTHKSIKPAEVSLHSSRDDCWILVNGQVWDMTIFMKTHPRGEDGMGASDNSTTCVANATSKSYSSMPEKMLRTPITKRIAPNFLHRLCRKLTWKVVFLAKYHHHGVQYLTARRRRKNCFHHSRQFWVFMILNLGPRNICRRKLGHSFPPAATGMVSERANRALWEKICFRPRIMRNVKNVNTERVIHGVKAQLRFVLRQQQWLSWLTNLSSLTLEMEDETLSSFRRRLFICCQKNALRESSKCWPNLICVQYCHCV